MKFIDFLSLPGNDAGASYVQGVFRVERPWGACDYGSMALAEGWYAFDAQCDGLVLVLRDERRYTVIELEARSGTPAYIRLLAGTYSVSLMPGARPGRYQVGRVTFQSMSAFTRYALLGGRLLQALRRGTSISRIAGLIKLACARKTFGLRAAGADRSAIGMLCRQDIARYQSGALTSDAAARLTLVADGPRFLIRGVGGRTPPADIADGQVYTRFTLDPIAPHDFIVFVEPDDILTPDALLLFAEHLGMVPGRKVALADKWIGDQPTARVPWDPYLYEHDIPAPYAVARGASAVVTVDNQADFSIISIPLASGHEAEMALSPTPVLSTVAERQACSIIIPTRDRADLLQACLAGLFDQTEWPHEVIVVDNGSIESETFALFEAYADKGLKVIRRDIPFNFSILCNAGAQAARHDYLVFLNNDVVLSRGDWLSQMMALAVLPHAGAIGARLLYADGRLQHGGVMLGLTQMCGHLWRGLPLESQPTEPRLVRTSLRSAVTAACLCVEKAKFEAVGGFDEIRFPVTLNDIDLCLKLRARGWISVYAAQAEAFHLESESRGADESPEDMGRRQSELDAFQQAWGAAATTDPWFPQAFSRATEGLRYR